MPPRPPRCELIPRPDPHLETLAGPLKRILAPSIDDDNLTDLNYHSIL